MSTTYDDIYDRFLVKITDYELAELVDNEIENQLHKYLIGAISDFKYASKKLANRDEVKSMFNEDLKDIEKEILAKFMIVHWLSPQILRLENVRNELGNKDFKLYSPANFLDKISKVRSDLRAEANQDMVYYCYGG
ncbi:hypothetical protein [Paenibacillus lactis]|uniref:hypothetical protein n=1 Tax=Paenibacillus lactis TaxID=228574 RepID=UPI003D71627B